MVHHVVWLSGHSRWLADGGVRHKRAWLVLVSYVTFARMGLLFSTKPNVSCVTALTSRVYV